MAAIACQLFDRISRVAAMLERRFTNLSHRRTGCCGVRQIAQDLSLHKILTHEWQALGERLNPGFTGRKEELVCFADHLNNYTDVHTKLHTYIPTYIYIYMYVCMYVYIYIYYESQPIG